MRTSRPTPRFLHPVLVGLCLLLLGVSTADAGKRNRKPKKEKPIASAEVETMLAASPIPELPGPRRTVAVMKFTGRSDFLAQYGFSDVGGGLTAMLTTALVESGRFLVVERANLSEVFSEQQLKASGLVTEESGPRIGTLTGAQLIVTGDVTEFTNADKRRGFSVGFAGLDKLAGGLAPQKQIGTVGIDVRVIDASTGQVIASFNVKEQVVARSIKMTVDYDDVSLGGHDFNSTALGLAARLAINKVAGEFAARVAAHEWTGRVVQFEGGEIAINAGTTSGITAGDTFRVVRVAKVLTDPETGQPLGGRRRALGNLIIRDVESGVAFGEFQPAGAAFPQRGDLVLAAAN